MSIAFLNAVHTGFVNLFSKNANRIIAAVIKAQFAGNGKKFNFCIKEICTKYISSVIVEINVITVFIGFGKFSSFASTDAKQRNNAASNNSKTT